MPDELLPESLLEFSEASLGDWCRDAGIPAFRARQIRHWVFEKRVYDFDKMHSLPKPLRERLSSSFEILAANVAAHQRASDNTEKLLLEWRDNESVECVLMRETSRRTACISTQVGCAMGCVFCASGLLGLKRNLSRGEILEQVVRIEACLKRDEKLTNLVVMGIGEPLANLDALLSALADVHSPNGLGLGARRITISTVGLPLKMRELAESGRQYNLAVSLHAPNDELRNRLVPVNDRVGIDEIVQAADYYFASTGRRVTYEYVLLGGVNDASVHARQLSILLRERNAHVNLIPMNDVSALPYSEPAQPRTQQFLSILEQNGVPATIRKRKGADIDAACGQLRLERSKPSPEVIPLTETALPKP